MKGAQDTETAVGRAPARTRGIHRTRGLVGTGILAALAAMAGTTLVAALARALGVDFQVPEGGETIPLPGITVVTGFFSLVGVGIAAALLRWSARPAERFTWTALSLTASSLVPPLLVGADAATTATLVLLHLVAAAVMIPTLARSLGARAAMWDTRLGQVASSVRRSSP